MSRATYTRVYDAVLAIPEGSVASYGEVARRAGMEGRARLVGRALRELPEGSVVPWQRVLRASGHLAFPSGDERHRLQIELLRGEGVCIEGGRVDMRRYGIG